LTTIKGVFGKEACSPAMENVDENPCPDPDTR
jgi:hypothetical protein